MSDELPLLIALNMHQASASGPVTKKKQSMGYSVKVDLRPTFDNKKNTAVIKNVSISASDCQVVDQRSVFVPKKLE